VTAKIGGHDRAATVAIMVSSAQEANLFERSDLVSPLPVQYVDQAQQKHAVPAAMNSWSDAAIPNH
jgi:hypothetical protein